MVWKDLGLILAASVHVFDFQCEILMIMVTMKLHIPTSSFLGGVVLVSNRMGDSMLAKKHASHAAGQLPAKPLSDMF